jgi:two-component system chemotaxis sensor kinase CheA
VVTDLSGHGLGMAIVREAVERLGGELLVETRAGAGTTVRLRLPSAVATFRGLLVRAGHQEFLLSIKLVERVLRVSAKDLAATGGRTLLSLNGQAIPAGSLAAALGRGEDGPTENGARRPCVVVSTGDDRAALLVDEVLGEREVLVKELRPPLVKVPHVAGAGLLGNGELVLILQPADLMRALREAPSPAPGVVAATDAAPPAILVVDDSITTRTMERNLLESAGYRVEVAVDGIEAWTTLNAGRFDLVVSDVDMPRMSGFELTARIRADPRLANLPVVLVSALESREDKERGVAAGANAYVIKSGFDQSKLLEIIRRLI